MHGNLSKAQKAAQKTLWVSDQQCLTTQSLEVLIVSLVTHTIMVELFLNRCE